MGGGTMILPKASQYPKTLEINDEVYTIKLVKRIPHKDSCPTDNGLCDYNTRTIYIRSTQSRRGMFRTFIHEVLHAIHGEWSFKLNHKTVYELEVALDALIVDNFL